MLKKFAVFVVCVFMLSNLYGCFALLAAGAAGGGTAFWLSGKLADEVNASMERTTSAAESAMRALDISTPSRVVRGNVIQLRGEYPSGADVNIDIFRISDNKSKVEIRVGIGDKDTSEKILSEIHKRI